MKKEIEKEYEIIYDCAPDGSGSFLASSKEEAEAVMFEMYDVDIIDRQCVYVKEVKKSEA